MSTDKHRYKGSYIDSSSKLRLNGSTESTYGYLWLILCIILVQAVPAQVRPVYDRGAVGLVQTLKRLNTSASVLMIGAHPDDEDTALLAYLARGESARTAYLSLTRGDGGQNIIGPELGEALGVIRTEELLQARRLDGAEQYFTRAYDYGFSKTLDEARQKWDEKVILCDAVRVVRNFRPLVVIAQFSGKPVDGHGQHQFAGYITPLAVKAANDASQCRETGPVWQVKKVYVRHGFRATGDPKLKINTGRYDPLLGRSYFEIAMEARSQHKSQEQGVLELRGEQFSGVNLVGIDAKESGVFDGLDTSVAAAAAELPISTSSIAQYQAALVAARRDLDMSAPERIVPHLLKAYSTLATEAQVIRSEAGRRFLVERMSLLAEAIVLASGAQIDALAERETAVPGESLLVGAKAFVPKGDVIKVKALNLIVPDRWVVTSTEQPKTNSAAFVTRENAASSAFFNLTVPRDWSVTEPYWLSDPRDGDLFRWNRHAASHTLPFQPEELRLSATFEVAGTEITVERPVEYRFADDIRGEIRRRVDVVPAISISLEKDLLIAPRGSAMVENNLAVRVTNNTSRDVDVVLQPLKPGVGAVSAELAQSKLTLKARESAVTYLRIRLVGEFQAAPFVIGVAAKLNGATYIDEMKVVAYPHIQTHRFYKRAATKVVLLNLVVEKSKVGYITGSGDRVPEAIRQMGFDLEMISASELASGNLAKYDTIVVGIRAYQVRPDVVANNQRLLDYARNGGTLIVQYQLPGYAQQNLPPFPVQMGPRVADENAAMKILVPEHPVFNSPNKITDADFVGWVQERNLYNFTNMPADYTGLIESHDAGEAENQGGLVFSKIGKGNYIYCSYSMFRQLPAGVPGAYRLFANLLSLPKSK